MQQERGEHMQSSRKNSKGRPKKDNNKQGLDPQMQKEANEGSEGI